MSFTTDIKKARLLLAGRYPRDQITVKSLLWSTGGYRVEAFHTVTVETSHEYVREVLQIVNDEQRSSCCHYVEWRTHNGLSFRHYLNDLCGPSNEDPLDHVTTPSFEGQPLFKGDYEE